MVNVLMNDEWAFPGEVARFILSSRVGVEKNEQLRKSSRASSIVTVGQYSVEQMGVFEVCALPSRSNVYDIDVVGIILEGPEFWTLRSSQNWVSACGF